MRARTLFQIDHNPEATIVHVRCDIDFAVSDQFLDVLTLARDHTTPLVVSLEECAYMDCAGLSALVKVRNASRAGLSVVVRGGSLPSKLLALAGLEKRLGVTASRGASVAA